MPEDPERAELVLRQRLHIAQQLTPARERQLTGELIQYGFKISGLKWLRWQVMHDQDPEVFGVWRLPAVSPDGA